MRAYERSGLVRAVVASAVVFTAWAGRAADDATVAQVVTGSISDAAHGCGTPGFYFLPPIAAPTAYGGPFTHGLWPVVQIEELDGRGAIATFTRASGRSGGAFDRVTEEGDAYTVLWNTRGSALPGFVYRVRVLLDDRELGRADVRLPGAASVGANAPSDGGSPPVQIRFRIGTIAPPRMTTYAAGPSPWGVAFDGESLWVTNNGADTVTRFRPRDGAVLGTFDVGNHPRDIAFDGTYLWVVVSGTASDPSTGAVVKLDPRDGAVLATSPVAGAWGVVADGENVWVGALMSTVVKLRASDGALLGTFTPGVPHATPLAFDGTSVWASDQLNITGNHFVLIRVSDGAITDIPYWGRYATFDGENMWVSGSCDPGAPVFKLRVSDLALLAWTRVEDGPGGHVPGGGCPFASVFDGDDLWVVLGPRAVARIRGCDGALLGIYEVAWGLRGIAFDGTDVWVANSSDDTLTRVSIGTSSR